MDIEKRKEKMRQYRREHYYRNKQQYFDRNKRRRIELKEWLWEIKKNSKCEKCEFNHPAALDWHHKNPDEKSFEISQGYRVVGSKKRILEEMQRCQVLCANCHRIFHYKERNRAVI